MPDLPSHFADSLALVKGRDPDGTTWSRLEEAYRRPPRHFHTLAQVGFPLGVVEELGLGSGPLRLALFYLYAVFDPCGEANELQSARFAVDELTAAGVAEHHRARVYDLIRATDPLPSPQGEEEDLIQDLRHAVLGSDPEQFHRSEDQRRAEFDWLPDHKYARQRLAEIGRLLDQSPLFRHPACRQRFEESARRNLAEAARKWRG